MYHQIFYNLHSNVSGIINYKIIVDLYPGYCEELEVSKAQVSPSGRVVENTVVTVTCTKQSRLLIGHREVTCQSGGKWSTELKCEETGRYERCFLVNVIVVFNSVMSFFRMQLPDDLNISPVLKPSPGKLSFEQELCSWFEVNAKFPSTSLAAYITRSTQSHLYLSDSTMHSST